MNITHFQTFLDKETPRQWRWRLLAANGEPIASPGEGFTSKENCLHNIALVKAAANAPIDPTIAEGG